MDVSYSAKLREFNCLYKEASSLYYELALKSGISESAFWIMYAMAELGDGCLQKDIADRYSISRQTISSSVRNLEKKGYLFLKHGKGRNMHLFLTQEGKLFVQANILPLVKAENEVFESMSPEESEEFLRLTRIHTEILKNKIQELL